MKFKEILNRLTGISVPVFGIQWSPSELEITKARRIISFLEDRRVFYNPYDMETSEYCIHSINEVRHFLTTELGGVDESSEFAHNLRAMRAACRKFLNTCQEDKKQRIIVFYRDNYESHIFFSALGELRGIFGIHIGLIAAQHGLDIEDELASILPECDEVLNLT